MFLLQRDENGFWSGRSDDAAEYISKADFHCRQDGRVVIDNEYGAVI